jgi:hypothetical protein
MVKALARWVLGLDKSNIPKPQIVERVVYRQAGMLRRNRSEGGLGMTARGCRVTCDNPGFF